MALSSADLQKMLQAIAGQAQQMGPNPNQFASQPTGQGRQKGLLDAIQGLLDLGGIVDPTPTLDWINAGISLTRAAMSKTDTERGEHLKNAAISGISGAVPYLGDMAKLGKYELKVGKEGARGGLSSLLGMFGQQQTQSPFGEPPVEATVVNPTPQPPTPPQGFNRFGTSVPPPPGGTPPPPPVQPPAPPPSSGGSGQPPSGWNRYGTSSPPPPPPPPPPGNTYAGAFGIGAIAGGALGSMDIDPKPMREIRHGLGEALAGPGASAVGSDMKRMLSRPLVALETALNPFENPITKLTTAVKATVMTMIEMPGAIKNWGEALKESQRHLMMLNGQMAGAFMQSEMRDMMRDIKSARGTAGSTADLMSALSDFKDELRPFGDAITNSLNRIVQVLLMTGTAAIKIAMAVDEFTTGGLSSKILAWLAKSEAEAVPTAAFEYMEWLRKLPDAVTKPPRRR